MTKRQKLIELAKKLREMALKGTPNERIVAKKKLDEISVKYKIDIEKLFYPITRKKRVFKLGSFLDEKDLIVHSIIDTFPEAQITGNEQLRQIHVLLSDAEYKEVNEKFCFYWDLYLKEREALLSAFIIKNDIGIVDRDNEIEQDINSVVEYMNLVRTTKYKQKQLL